MVAGRVRALRTGLLLIALGACLACVPNPAGAVPANPEQRFDLPQPDGSTVRARPFGDEFTNGFETLDGYTLIEQGDWWEYARKTADGDLEPTGLRAGVDDPSGLPRGLRDTSEPPPDSPFGARGRLGGPLESDELISGRAVPAIGIQRSLVILAQFADQPSLGTTPAQWSSRFFGATDSVRDYYDEVSYGALDIQPAAESSGTANDGIVGWLTLPPNHPRTQRPRRPRRCWRAMQATIRDAITAANPFVNYAAFDTNGDGAIVPRRAARDGDHGRLGGLADAAARRRSGATSATPAPRRPRSTASCVGLRLHHVRRGALRQRRQPPAAHGDARDHGARDRPRPRHARPLRHRPLDVPTRRRRLLERDGARAAGAAARAHLPGADPPHPDAFLKSYQGWLTPRGRGTVAGRAVPAGRDRRRPAPSARSPTPAASTGTSAATRAPASTSWSRTASSPATTAALPGCGMLIWHIDESPRPLHAPNADDQRRLRAADAGRRQQPARSAPATPGRQRARFDDRLDAEQPPRQRHPSDAARQQLQRLRRDDDADSRRRHRRRPGRPRRLRRGRDADRRAAHPHRGVDTATATVEAGEPTAACAGIGNTVWFRLHADRERRRASSTRSAATFDTVAAVYRGTTLTSLHPVACNDDIDNAASNPLARRSSRPPPARRTTCRSAASRASAAPRPSGLADLRPHGGPAPRRPTTRSRPPPRVATLPFAQRRASTRAPPPPRPASRPRRARPPSARRAWFRYAPTATARSSPTPSAATSTPSSPSTAARRWAR